MTNTITLDLCAHLATWAVIAAWALTRHPTTGREALLLGVLLMLLIAGVTTGT